MLHEKERRLKRLRLSLYSFLFGTLFVLFVLFAASFTAPPARRIRALRSLPSFRALFDAATSSSVPSKAATPPRILYVVRTCPKFYDTRLRDALETYLSGVPAELILVVGISAHNLTVPDWTGLGGGERPAGKTRVISVMATDEGADARLEACLDNHDEGVTCVEGRALLLAFERRCVFDWVFVVDDDAYVHRLHLEMTVEGLSEEAGHVYAVPGCGLKAKCTVDPGGTTGGICGGGGYFLSKRNLEKTVCGIPRVPKVGGAVCEQGNAVEGLSERWMETWMGVGAEIKKQDGGWWSDVTAGCMYHKFGGLTIKEPPGLHPWTVSPKDLVTKLTKDAPLSFHYVTAGEMPGMRGMHKLVTGTNRRSRLKFNNDKRNKTDR